MIFPQRYLAAKKKVRREEDEKIRKLLTF